MTRSPFQKTIATSKDQRLLAWSHIYLGRMLDLECKRDEAMAEYKEAMDSARRPTRHAPCRRARREERPTCSAATSTTAKTRTRATTHPRQAFSQAWHSAKGTGQRRSRNDSSPQVACGDSTHRNPV